MVVYKRNHCYLNSTGAYSLLQQPLVRVYLQRLDGLPRIVAFSLLRLSPTALEGHLHIQALTERHGPLMTTISDSVKFSGYVDQNSPATMRGPEPWLGWIQPELAPFHIASPSPLLQLAKVTSGLRPLDGEENWA